jgi:hypothetical protein
MSGSPVIINLKESWLKGAAEIAARSLGVVRGNLDIHALFS